MAQDRIAILARQPHPLFHAHDLCLLWGLKNKNTLYTLLKRYTQRGLLFRVYKGLYSLLPIEKLDPPLLGLKALHGFAYVSTETILIQAGIMSQVGYAYTLISDCSRHFQIGPHQFRSRQLRDRYLYNPAGIVEENGILKATVERAVADLLYFNPKAYFDGYKMVDAKKVRAFQKEIGYPLTPLSDATPA